MRRFFVAFMLMVVLLFAFIGLRFGSALTQEGNPIPYLIAIAKYELFNNGYEKVLESPHEIRYISAFEVKYPLGMAIEFMKNKGWKFKEQMGSGLIFEKGNEVLTISTRQYTKHYFIWDVPK